MSSLFSMSHLLLLNMLPLHDGMAMWSWLDMATNMGLFNIQDCELK